MKKIGFALIAAILLLGSCKKKDEVTTDVTFTNRIAKDVVLTIYPSFDDYSNGTNPTLRRVVPASDKTILPASTFSPGKTYYMDWHTDNFYTNNWFNDLFPQPGTQIAIRPVAGNNTYYFDPAFAGSSRTTFLANDDKMSKWYAVDAYLYSVSTGYLSQWNTLTDFQKYRQVTVHKNFTADYTYKTSVGSITTDVLNFKVHPSADAFIEFMKTADSSTGSMMSGKLPTGIPPDYKSSAKDTIMALLPNSDYYFIMVRE